MRRLDAPKMATDKGAYLTEKISSLPKVDHVRGRGLLLGVQLSAGMAAKDVYVHLLAKGLIVNAVNETTIRLAPPITVTYEEMDEAISLIASELS
jgi:acetylornithine aminotransferase